MSDTAETDRQTVPYDEAVAMLPDGELVHTFRNGAPSVLIGADWEKAQLLPWILEYGVELSGEQATAMHHGLVGRDDYGYLFIETRKV